MQMHLPSRLYFGAALVLLFATGPAFARGGGQRAAPHPPAPRAQRAQPPNAAVRPEPRIAARPAENQDHMQRWMDNHSNLSLPEMQRALQNELGFRDLPRQVQQYEVNDLARLYNMDPQQRARSLDRNEALERLTPPQRQEWRNAVQQLNALPQPRRRVLARAILDLREMPPEQRQQTIDSAAFRAQFSDSERTMLSTLLTVEPYTPRPTPTP